MSDLARVRHWAQALIALHLDPAVWTFDFDHARTRAGQCDHSRHRITVSRHIAARADDDEIHQVLVHEVAHAIAGPRTGHGPRWRAVAADLGYVGSRLYRGPAADDLAAWVGTCPGGHRHVRHRRPTRPVSCALCSRGFDPRFRIEWRRRVTD